MAYRYDIKTVVDGVAILTRPDDLHIRVGDHVEIKTDRRWGGGNRAEVLAILPTTIRAVVSHENRRRTKFPPSPTKLGEFDVPYSAIEGRIY